MRPANLPDHISRALAYVQALLSPCRDKWHIYGSCGLALHGIEGVVVRDIDVLLSRRDAEALLGHLSARNEAGEGTDKFRSDIFIRRLVDDCEIELMSDMRVAIGEDWQAFSFETHETVAYQGRVYGVPSLEELKASLRLFGRAKDLARLKLIEAETS